MLRRPRAQQIREPAPHACNGRNKRRPDRNGAGVIQRVKGRRPPSLLSRVRLATRRTHQGCASARFSVFPLQTRIDPASKASARSRIVPCTSGLPPAQWTSWAGAFRRTMKSWLAASSRTATNSVWAWLFCGCFGLRLTASPAAITSRLLHRPFEPLAKSWRLFSLGRDYGTGMSETASRPLALSLAGSSLMKRNLVWVEVAVNVTENCFQT